MTYLGLQLPSFTFDGVGTDRLFERIAETALAAESSGCRLLLGHGPLPPDLHGRPRDRPDARGVQLLSGVAARTSRIFLGTMVTGVTYRNPAFLAKVVTTLDVVSSGRAILGMGAAWNEHESRAYGYD